MKAAAILKFLTVGQWREGQVGTSKSPSSRIIDEQVESNIARAWQDGLRVPGIHLFDGPMCRLEKWTASADLLHLKLSPTSYRIFFGTHLSGRGAGIDPRCRANSIGVSTGLLTSDGLLMFGHRSSAVAYYPNRVHPFAGTLEPRDGENVFAAVRRELREELSLEPSSIESIVCLGLVEDSLLCQPELIFVARADLPAERIARQVDPAEHGKSWSIPANISEIDRALTVATSQMTPVAIATLLLIGRFLGREERWFASRAAGFTRPAESS
jgi:8-oxo-dGTP pyrophosphatase MutT (NUDIX family)